MLKQATKNACKFCKTLGFILLCTGYAPGFVHMVTSLGDCACTKQVTGATPGNRALRLELTKMLNVP